MPKTECKILLYDIETAPTFGAFFQLYKEGNIVWIAKHWYILSFAYKWLDSKKINVLSLPDFETYHRDKENDKELIKELWKLFDEADIIIAHNGIAFDTRKTNARFVFHGLKPPSPYKEIDTKKVAKTYFKFDSNKLDDLGNYLNIGRKLPTGGFELWQKCLNGDLKAWKTMCRYNKGDVALLERVYLKLRPYIKNHPNRALIDGNRTACPNCSSKNVQKRGYWFTRTTANQKYQCMDCGSWHSSPLNKFNRETQIR